MAISEPPSEDDNDAPIVHQPPDSAAPPHAIFFTVETVLLRRFYVLFFIAHATRRVWLAGCTKNPTGEWVTQQARNLGLDVSDAGVRFLIRDRDSKYSGSFDEVFRSEGIRIVKTPIRAPKANAIAERFVRTVRSECLDWLLILNRRHLEHALRVFVDHYNRERPHRGLDLRPPLVTSGTERPTGGAIHRRDRLGGPHPRVLPSRRLKDIDNGALQGPQVGRTLDGLASTRPSSR
jgi:putative transposase